MFVSQRPQLPNKGDYTVWLFFQPLVREGRACKKQADAFFFFFWKSICYDTRPLCAHIEIHSYSLFRTSASYYRSLDNWDLTRTSVVLQSSGDSTKLIRIAIIDFYSFDYHVITGMNLNMHLNTIISLLFWCKSCLSRAIQHAMEKYLSENLAGLKAIRFLLFCAEKSKIWIHNNSIYFKMKHKHIK